MSALTSVCLSGHKPCGRPSLSKIRSSPRVEDVALSLTIAGSSAGSISVGVWIMVIGWLEIFAHAMKHARDIKSKIESAIWNSRRIKSSED